MTTAKVDMQRPDPLGMETIKAWLGIQACDSRYDAILDILVKAGKSRAQEYTGFDMDGDNAQTRYIHGWPKSIKVDPDLTHELFVHSNGHWNKQKADVIGDTLCLSVSCGCSCDCNFCDGAPRLMLVSHSECKEPLVRSAVINFVLKYVAYNFENRGDTDAKSVRDLEAYLKPYRKIAFS